MNLHEFIVLNKKVPWKHWNTNYTVPFDDFISACPLKKANKSFFPIMQYMCYIRGELEKKPKELELTHWQLWFYHHQGTQNYWDILVRIITDSSISSLSLQMLSYHFCNLVVLLGEFTEVLFKVCRSSGCHRVT